MTQNYEKLQSNGKAHRFSTNGTANQASQAVAVTQSQATENETPANSNCKSVDSISEVAMSGVMFTEFNILNYKDQLTPMKGKDRYQCPVCQGNNLTISAEGKYQCWNGCDCSDIREALAPWAEKRRNQQPKPKHSAPKAKSKAKRVPPPDSIRLALLPDNREPAPKPRKVANSDGSYRLLTLYQYSTNQWVERIEYYSSDGTRSKKEYRQWHRAEDETEVCKKGDGIWPAYRENEVIEALISDDPTFQSNCFLIVEGESCTEASRSLGFVALTFQGSSWKFKENDEAAISLRKIKATGKPDIGMIIWPDNDKTGSKKAAALIQACNEHKIWYYVIEPSLFDLPEKGDIVDAIKMHGAEEVRERLLEILQRAAPEYQDSVAQEINATYSESIPDSYLPDQEFTQRVLNSLYVDKPWICVNNHLYYWTGTYYQKSDDGAELKRIADFADDFAVPDRQGNLRYPYAKPSKTREALQWVKDRLYVSSELINPAGINCTNGVLKIKWNGSTPSWELVKHDPSMYYIYPPIATYNPLANPKYCEQLLSALDEPQKEIFLRTIAASLDLPTVRKYKGRSVRALLCKGYGSNGKDAFREIVAAMYGYQGIAGATLSDFAQYDQGRKFPLAKLESCRVNWASENASFSKLDKLQSLKAFITGDPIDKERKGQDEKEYIPIAIALFNCNDTPNMTGAMEAIQSRYGILTFDKTFKIDADPTKGEIEADPRFKYDPEFLRQDVLPAFLNRVLAALSDLMQNGIDYSCTQKALEEIQAENSHLWQFCQDTGLSYQPNAVTPIGQIWKRLEEWYVANGTLTHEKSDNGKKKMIWVDQVKKSDPNVKGANQVLARLHPLFPKAKRIKITSGEFKNQIALVGIAFSDSGGSCDSEDEPTRPANPSGGISKPVVSQLPYQVTQLVSQSEMPETLPEKDLSDLGKASKSVFLPCENLTEKIAHVFESNVEDRDQEIKESEKLASQDYQSNQNVEVVTDLGDTTALPDALLDTEAALPMEQTALPMEQDINMVQGLKVQSKRPWPSAKLPEIGDRVNTSNGQGTVMESGTDQNYEIYFEVLIDGSTKSTRYSESQLLPYELP